MKKQFSKLVDVKSIVTLTMTIGFLYLAITKEVVPEQFMELYKVVIIFYFGTQYQKKQNEIEKS